VIYLASPYSHPDPEIREQRFQAACKFAAEMLRQGIHVFSAIAHTHPIALYGLPKGWDFWEPYDRALMGLCDEIIVIRIEGWKESKGVAAEVEIAKAFGMPITYMDPTP